MVKYKASRFFITEPIVYFLIMLIFVIIGLFYINSVVERVEKRVNLLNATELVRLVGIHHSLHPQYDKETSEIRYKDYTIQELLKKEILGENRDSAFGSMRTVNDLYSIDSYVRVIYYEKKNYYQIKLCDDACDDGHTFIDTITTLKPNEIQNTLEVKSLQVSDVHIKKRTWWKPFH